MEKPVTEEVAASVVALGGLTLAFSRVMRATAKEDGETLESDTDHTVMLGLIATAFAARFEPALDLGKVAQFALVHDLVEAYAGDTNTFGARYDKKDDDKERRERAALDRIHQEFDATLPWLAETIEAYESLTTPEARYVKTMDKVMPKVTHALNDGKRLHNHLGAGEFAPFTARQRAHLARTYGEGQHAVLALYDALVARVTKIL